MSRIDDLLAELCPGGVDYKTLGDVGTFVRGNGLQKADLTDAGFPAIHYGQIHTYYKTSATETASFVTPVFAQRLRKANPGDLVIATTSEDDEAVAKAVAWIGATDAVVSGDSYIYRHTLVPKYASYFFQSNQFQLQKRRFITGTKVRRISGDGLAKIRIPVPPVAVQEEIVMTLDLLEGLPTALEAELDARQRQYAYYRHLLLWDRGDGVEWANIGDIGPVRMCRRVFKEETRRSGDIPFYKIGTFGGVPDAFITRDLYESYRSRFSFPKRGDVLISAAGTIGRAIRYDGKDAYFQDSNIVWVENPETRMLNSFLYYVYQVIKWETADGGTIKRLYNDNILRARVPVPPLGEQARIVDILDKFDCLVNDESIGIPAELKARRAQYAYYRDRLLTMQEAVA